MLRYFNLKIIIFSLCVVSFFSLSLFSFLPSSYAAHPYRCHETYPAIAPVLVSAVPGNQSVTLTWTQQPEQISYYLLEYGLDSSNIIYGNPYIGDVNTRTYTVNNLTNGVRYYFRVRPVNQCKPGNASNTLAAIAGGYQKSTSGPNLSLYKTSTQRSNLPAGEFTQKGAKPHVLGASTKKVIRPFISPELLLALEAILLILFFIIATKITFISRVFSFIIPLAVLAAFFNISRLYSSENFFSRYFLQLDIIIFVAVIALSKLLLWKEPRKLYSPIGENKQ